MIAIEMGTLPALSKGDAELIAAIGAACGDGNQAVHQRCFAEQPAPPFRPTARSGPASSEAPQISDKVARLKALRSETNQSKLLELKSRLCQKTVQNRPSRLQAQPLRGRWISCEPDRQVCSW